MSYLEVTFLILNDLFNSKVNIASILCEAQAFLIFVIFSDERLENVCLCSWSYQFREDVINQN